MPASNLRDEAIRAVILTSVATNNFTNPEGAQDVFCWFAHLSKKEQHELCLHMAGFVEDIKNEFYEDIDANAIIDTIEKFKNKNTICVQQ